MYFDFEDDHPDITPVGGAISWREGALLSIIVHLLAVLGVVMMPEFPGASEARERIEAELAAEQQREREAQRFVFVQPHLDVPAPSAPPPRADLSDRDRVARAPERAPNPTNMLPFSRGNSPERVEAEPGSTSPPAPSPSSPPPGAAAGDHGEAGEGAKGTPPLGASGLLLPAAPEAGRGDSGRGAGSAGTGVLGRALQDLQRYVQPEQFDNQGGGAGAFGPSIQFDTKGVEFGPWIRRFVAQIKRNWFIPYAAMAMRGHVVVTFNVMKDGRVQEIAVPGPCSVDAFNNAAFNAMAASNPTYPLPAEYPADRAFFTVTFYYNESPPIR